MSHGRRAETLETHYAEMFSSAQEDETRSASIVSMARRASVDSVEDGGSSSGASSCSGGAGFREGVHSDGYEEDVEGDEDLEADSLDGDGLEDKQEDDTEEKNTSALPLHQPSPHRSSLCLRAPCLKRTAVATPLSIQLREAQLLSPSPGALGIPSSFAAPRSFSPALTPWGGASGVAGGVSPVLPLLSDGESSASSCGEPEPAAASNPTVSSRRPSSRHVRFDSGPPEAGLTHSGQHYDRRPIECTHGTGSSLDLSLKRCSTLHDDEDEDEDEEEEVGNPTSATRDSTEARKDAEPATNSAVDENLSKLGSKVQQKERLRRKARLLHRDADEETVLGCFRAAQKQAAHLSGSSGGAEPILGNDADAEVSAELQSIFCGVSFSSEVKGSSIDGGGGVGGASSLTTDAAASAAADANRVVLPPVHGIRAFGGLSKGGRTSARVKCDLPLLVGRKASLHDPAWDSSDEGESDEERPGAQSLSRSSGSLSHTSHRRGEEEEAIETLDDGHGLSRPSRSSTSSPFTEAMQRLAGGGRRCDPNATPKPSPSVRPRWENVCGYFEIPVESTVVAHESTDVVSIQAADVPSCTPVVEDTQSGSEESLEQQGGAAGTTPCSGRARMSPDPDPTLTVAETIKSISPIRGPGTCDVQPSPALSNATARPDPGEAAVGSGSDAAGLMSRGEGSVRAAQHSTGTQSVAVSDAGPVVHQLASTSKDMLITSGDDSCGSSNADGGTSGVEGSSMPASEVVDGKQSVFPNGKGTAPMPMGGGWGLRRGSSGLCSPGDASSSGYDGLLSSSAATSPELEPVGSNRLALEHAKRSERASDAPDLVETNADGTKRSFLTPASLAGMLGASTPFPYSSRTSAASGSETSSHDAPWPPELSSPGDEPIALPAASTAPHKLPASMLALRRAQSLRQRTLASEGEGGGLSDVVVRSAPVSHAASAVTSASVTDDSSPCMSADEALPASALSTRLEMVRGQGGTTGAVATGEARDGDGVGLLSPERGQRRRRSMHRSASVNVEAGAGDNGSGSGGGGGAGKRKSSGANGGGVGGGGSSSRSRSTSLARRSSMPDNASLGRGRTLAMSRPSFGLDEGALGGF